MRDKQLCKNTATIKVILPQRLNFVSQQLKLQQKPNLKKIDVLRFFLLKIFLSQINYASVGERKIKIGFIHEKLLAVKVKYS